MPGFMFLFLLSKFYSDLSVFSRGVIKVHVFSCLKKMIILAQCRFDRMGSRSSTEVVLKVYLDVCFGRVRNIFRVFNEAISIQANDRIFAIIEDACHNGENENQGENS